MDTTSFMDFSVSRDPKFESVAFTTGIDGKDERLLIKTASGLASFPISDWKGFVALSLSEPLIYRSDFTIEPDLSSSFNAQTQFLKAGNIVRRAGRVYLCAKLYEGGWAQARNFDLIVGLPSLDPGIEIGFSKWALVQQIEGRKKVLKEFDTGRGTGPDQ